jgi:hypothetical protein
MVSCWIFAGDVAIGWSELTIRDRSMGVIGGVFRALPAYDAVRAHIQVTSWDLPNQMRLIARTETGDQLDPVAGVFIIDALDGDVCEVTVVGLDSAVLRRFFDVAL